MNFGYLSNRPEMQELPKSQNPTSWAHGRLHAAHSAPSPGGGTAIYLLAQDVVQVVHRIDGIEARKGKREALLEAGSGCGVRVHTPGFRDELSGRESERVGVDGSVGAVDARERAFVSNGRNVSRGSHGRSSGGTRYDYANGAACSLPPRERGTCLCVRASFRVRTVRQRLVDTETTGETEKERAGGDWLNGPPGGFLLFWCVAWWSRGCCGLSAVLRCGGAAPWSVWILRVWVVSGVCERQVQSTTRVRSSGSEPRSNPTLKIC
jgi:hypothetical protein